MTKNEAIQLMYQGKRLTHRFFAPDEWVTINAGDFIQTEEGYTVSQKTFWHIRPGKEWDTDWELFKDQPQDTTLALIEEDSELNVTPGEWSVADGSHHIMSSERTGAIGQSFVMDTPGPHNKFMPDHEGLANAKLWAQSKAMRNVLKEVFKMDNSLFYPGLHEKIGTILETCKYKP